MTTKKSSEKLSSKCINHFIGTAGWTIPSGLKSSFPEQGTHLERYAKVFNGVEINSSFYNEHKLDTYVKWAASVPEHFRFSVKLSRYFTHETKLSETEKLPEVLGNILGLGSRFGVCLVQLPPSLEFNKKDVAKFIRVLQENLQEVPIVWEPRHISWNHHQAIGLLSEYKISRVIADPEPFHLSADLRRQTEFIRYLRLHGSPVIYKSRYEKEFLRKIKKLIDHSEIPVWCMFDNTTYGFATENALELYRS